MNAHRAYGSCARPGCHNLVVSLYRATSRRYCSDRCRSVVGHLNHPGPRVRDVDEVAVDRWLAGNARSLRLTRREKSQAYEMAAARGIKALELAARTGIKPATADRGLVRARRRLEAGGVR